MAGEASADLHGSNLVRELRARGARVLGAGGRRMRDAGMQIVHDPTGHATVGVIEAFRNLNRYLTLYRKLVSAVRNEKPNVVVLMDMPDFNLKFGEYVAQTGIPVVYYISPQIWAWRAGRIRKIKKIVRKMLVIFDFEEALYRREGVDVAFVGHPLMDVIGERFETTLRADLKISGDDLLIGLLPGSRKQQFDRLFPLEIKAAQLIRQEVPRVRFVIACAPTIDPRWAMNQRLADVVYNRTYDVMAASDLLIMSSGTATVEAAIFATPMIVTYKVNPLSALLARPFLRVKNYAMVNLIAGREIMPEYYQHRARPELIAREAIGLIARNRLPEMRRLLEEVRTRLGSPGASRRAAEEILALVR